MRPSIGNQSNERKTQVHEKLATHCMSNVLFGRIKPETLHHYINCVQIFSFIINLFIWWRTQDRFHARCGIYKDLVYISLNGREKYEFEQFELFAKFLFCHFFSCILSLTWNDAGLLLHFDCCLTKENAGPDEGSPIFNESNRDSAEQRRQWLIREQSRESTLPTLAFDRNMFNWTENMFDSSRNLKILHIHSIWTNARVRQMNRIRMCGVDVQMAAIYMAWMPCTTVNA